MLIYFIKVFLCNQFNDSLKKVFPQVNGKDVIDKISAKFENNYESFCINELNILHKNKSESLENLKRITLNDVKNTSEKNMNDITEKQQRLINIILERKNFILNSYLNFYNENCENLTKNFLNEYILKIKFSIKNKFKKLDILQNNFFTANLNEICEKIIFNLKFYLNIENIILKSIIIDFKDIFYKIMGDEVQRIKNWTVEKKLEIFENFFAERNKKLENFYENFNEKLNEFFEEENEEMVKSLKERKENFKKEILENFLPALT